MKDKGLKMIYAIMPYLLCRKKETSLLLNQIDLELKLSYLPFQIANFL